MIQFNSEWAPIIILAIIVFGLAPAASWALDKFGGRDRSR